MKKAAIAELMVSAYQVNKANGFWSEGVNRSIPMIKALISSEWTEMMEAFRNNQTLVIRTGYTEAEDSARAVSDALKWLQDLATTNSSTPDAWRDLFRTAVKDTVECELADVLIRCFDSLAGMFIGIRETGQANDAWSAKAIAERMLKIKAHIERHLPDGLEDFTLPQEKSGDLIFNRINYGQLLALGFVQRSQRREDGAETGTYMNPLDFFHSLIYGAAFALLIAERMNIDIESIIELTIHNNSLRGVLHGGKKF